MARFQIDITINGRSFNMSGVLAITCANLLRVVRQLCERTRQNDGSWLYRQPRFLPFINHGPTNMLVGCGMTVRCLACLFTCLDRPPLTFPHFPQDSVTGQRIMCWFVYEFMSGMENSVIIERVPPPPGDPRRNWRLRVFAGGMHLRGIMFAHAATRSGIQLPIDGETLGTCIRGPPHTHQNAFSVLDPTYVLMAANPPVDATGNPAELLQEDELNGTQRVYTHTASHQTVRLISHGPNGDGAVFDRLAGSNPLCVLRWFLSDV